LITANLAVERGKTVYAVPGPVNRPHSSGCHQLIREGATLLTCASELLEDEALFPNLKHSFNSNPSISEKNSTSKLQTTKQTEHSNLLDLLAAPSSAEEVATQLSMNIDEVLTLLTELELNGLVETDATGLFIKTN